MSMSSSTLCRLYVESDGELVVVIGGKEWSRAWRAEREVCTNAVEWSRARRAEREVCGCACIRASPSASTPKRSVVGQGDQS
jgi:hypothetical protein